MICIMKVSWPFQELYNFILTSFQAKDTSTMLRQRLQVQLPPSALQRLLPLSAVPEADPARARRPRLPNSDLLLSMLKAISAWAVEIRRLFLLITVNDRYDGIIHGGTGGIVHERNVH
jgi:hypothetical protein